MRDLFSYDRAAVEDMRHKTIVSIEGMRVGSEEIVFTLDNGDRYVMLHHQSCCETVRVEDVCGDVDDLIGMSLAVAYEESNYDKDAPSEFCESFTWTFYVFGSQKGAVTLRWLGTSNGYYSEAVQFVKLVDEEEEEEQLEV